MKIREFTDGDIVRVTPLYLEYFNNYEEGEWTEATVAKRLGQMLSREDSYGIVMEKEGGIAGFALGYFEQFDDGIAYDLIEIVVAAAYQNQGLGTEMMIALEKRVKEKGAFMISLQAVNDARHDRFYGRLGYGNCKNFVIKVKLI